MKPDKFDKNINTTCMASEVSIIILWLIFFFEEFYWLQLTLENFTIHLIKLIIKNINQSSIISFLFFMYSVEKKLLR